MAHGGTQRGGVAVGARAGECGVCCTLDGGKSGAAASSCCWSGGGGVLLLVELGDALFDVPVAQRQTVALSNNLMHVSGASRVVASKHFGNALLDVLTVQGREVPVLSNELLCLAKRSPD